jgi:hypothetical protein
MAEVPRPAGPDEQALTPGPAEPVVPTRLAEQPLRAAEAAQAQENPASTEPLEHGGARGNRIGDQRYASTPWYRKDKVIGTVGVIFLVLVTAIPLGALLFTWNESASNPSSSGSITFSPETFACGTSETISLTVHLPAFVVGTTTLTYEDEGVAGATFLVSDRFTRQIDNTWQDKETMTPGTFTCTSSDGGSVGKHNVLMRDQDGDVLATGSYTLTH